MTHPQDAPVLSVDSGGRPVAAALLEAEALRRHFAAPPPWEPEMRGEQPFVAREPMASAVLVGLVMREEALTVLLTRRALHLSAHPGQISFPGGRVEPQDRGPADTALREAREEIGLPDGLAQVLGCLPDYTTGTGFIVTPVVALVAPDFHPVIDAAEVAEVFEVPLSFLMTPAHHRRHEVEWAGQRRAFWSMLWPRAGLPGAAAPVPQPAGEDHLIWGATAAMLRNLYRFLLAGSV